MVPLGNGILRIFVAVNIIHGSSLGIFIPRAFKNPKSNDLLKAVMLYLAKIYYDLKNYKEALKHINESLILNENFSESIELRQKILELVRKEKKSDFIDDTSVI